MADWRDYILQHFRAPSHRLTLVSDPDALLLEERLLADIRRNGFHLVQYSDPVRFRYIYESQYRQKWDRLQPTELVVVLHAPNHDLRQLPYDLLQVGRRLQFRLSDLFPRLSNPVVCELDKADLDRLFAAYQDYHGEERGDRATREYVLEHVFGVSAHALQTPEDVLHYLLERHCAARRVPESLDRHLLNSLQRVPGLEEWPVYDLLRDRALFLSFLQRSWPRFLADDEKANAATHESRISYSPEAPALPLGDPRVMPHIDSLFVSGELRPVPVQEGWQRQTWMQIGIVRDPVADTALHFHRLVARARDTLPTADARYPEWRQFARLWAELNVMRYRLEPRSPLVETAQYADLWRRATAQFGQWMCSRYVALYNTPPSPPVMLHHVPSHLAALARSNPARRVALIVLDGMALSQWLVIRDVLTRQNLNLEFDESATFAWVPTITPVSRQSLFAGLPPVHFPSTWQRTDRDESRWRSFWQEEGLGPRAVVYAIGDDADDRMAEQLADPQLRVAGIVLRKVDNIMHGMQLGMAGMLQQVQAWAEQGTLVALLDRLARQGYDLYLTADHGNVEGVGIGSPAQNALIEGRGKRALQFNHPEFLEQSRARYPNSIVWQSEALPEGIHILLADQHDAFHDLNQTIVSHGGITIEEVIVPFVRARQRKT